MPHLKAAGSTTIDDFTETVGAWLPQRGPRTLAGLAFDALGRRPEPGDRVELDGVAPQVEAVDGPRISQLEITLAVGRAPARAGTLTAAAR